MNYKPFKIYLQVLGKNLIAICTLDPWVSIPSLGNAIVAHAIINTDSIKNMLRSILHIPFYSLHDRPDLKRVAGRANFMSRIIESRIDDRKK